MHLLYLLALLGSALFRSIDASDHNLGNGTCYHAETHRQLHGDTAHDLFPNKVTAEYSTLWNVTYHDTYKLLHFKGTDTIEPETYLLYQCGTTPPTDIPNISQTIAVPISHVGVQATSHIPFLELLGVRTSIKASYTSKDYISSPCLLEMIGDGDCVIAEDFDTWQPPLVEGLNVSFINYGEAPLVNNPVQVVEYLEPDTLAIGEYVKFFSLFFNLEEEANKIFDTIVERYTCVKATAQTYQFDLLQETQGAPRKIVWAYYTNYTDYSGDLHKGWSIAKCNGPDFDGSTGPYYCEMAAAVGVELLNSTIPGSIDVGGYNYYTDEEFLAFAKDADAFIFPSAYPTWETLHADKYEMLNQIRAVKNNRVYDNQGQGANDWYESPYAEPSTMMEDFAYVTADSNGNSYNDELVWFRKVDNENDEVGSPGTCTNGVNEKRTVRQSFTCLHYDIFDDFVGAAVSKSELSLGVVALASIVAIWGGLNGY